MRASQPRKYLTTVKLTDSEYGLPLRKSYAKTILKDAPVFPKPLEYKDIDKCFFEFVDKELNLVIEGQSLPTFTLYSNQRFSEYSQSWQHTDEEGNLLMNFKTVNRENNPKPGNNQGGLWNIPGEQRYTLLMRTVLEKNGEESYEIYSMKQPYCVDLTYRVSIITDKFENINSFNELVNSKFKARQYYIRPNGHFIPMILEELNDNTEYTISDRKFYNQTIIIKVMAYIISEKDFKVEKKPKRIKMFMEGDTKRPKPTVNIEEYFNDKINYQSVELTVDFENFHSKAEFDIDIDFNVEAVELYNVRNVRVAVNSVPYYIDKGFNVKNGDNIKLVIRQIDVAEKAQVKFIGYNPSITYSRDDADVDEETKFDDICVD